MKQFNIFGQLHKELAEFDKPILIAKTKKSKGYEFLQSDTLSLIDYCTNSKYESGDRDVEGRQKIYLNNSSFRADVASKQIDIDISHFNFVPEGGINSVYGAAIKRNRFRLWAKDNFYGEQVNDLVDRFPKYGTVVSKKVGKKVEVVPLRNLFNQPDAKSLKEARFCGEIHQMTLREMKKFPDWDTSKLELDFDDETTVYERYGYVPADWYKKEYGKTSKSNDDVYVVAILVQGKSKSKTPSGQVLFCEEAECPYEEAHWKRQDGRWLGIGVVEENFENQKARNMVENFRKNNLQWSGKKIFGSFGGDEVAQNLVSEVKDGQVLNFSAGGQFTQIDTTTRSLAEFSSAIQAYEENADQKAFTYEVSTGESLPSGTPFRLGVVMSNSVLRYYGLKREKLGLFLKRVYIKQILPEFLKENRKEQTLLIIKGGGMDTVLDAAKPILFNRLMKEMVKAGKPIDLEKMNEMVNSLPAIPVLLPEGYFDSIKDSVTLDITNEEVDVPKKMETLTTLYQAQVATDPEAAQETLAMIMVLAGENPPRKKMGMTGQIAQPTQAQPSMDQMAMANSPDQGEI